MRFSHYNLRVFGVLTAFMLAGCAAFSGNSLPSNGAAAASSQLTNSHFRDLYSFCRAQFCADGALPSGSIILDAAGGIYGNVSVGGTGARCREQYGCGAVVKLTPSGSQYTESVAYSFCAVSHCADGAYPAGNLAFDTAGALYGATTAGGSENGGVVFELQPVGSSYKERVLYQFCREPSCADGKAPQSGVMFDAGGALYGTTSGGGAYGYGAVFKLTPSASSYNETVLYSFCRRSGCADGQGPIGGLTMDKNGVLYGTTPLGGTRNGGVVFDLAGSGSRYTEHVLYRFCRTGNCTDGARPQARLVIDQHGALYGTTVAGGLGEGTVFRLTPSGARYTERVLHRFCHEVYFCVDGEYPAGGVVIDSTGVLYGNTNGGAHGAVDEGESAGGIYELAPSSGSRYTYRILHGFKNFNDLFPSTTPTLGGNTLYGVSGGGIPINGPGTGAIWEKPL